VPDCLTKDVLVRAEQLPPATDTAEAAAALGTGRRACADDTVPFALWVAVKWRDSFVDALWETVGGFGDCDTTCAIAGGVVAACETCTPPDRWKRYAEPLNVSLGGL